MTNKELFESTITIIKGQPMYAGQFYSADQVVEILKDLQSKIGDSGNVATKPMLAITKQMYDNLIERVDEHVTDAINSVESTDVIDASSIEMTISDGRATLDNISVNTDEIASHATWGLSGEIEDWADEWNIEILKASPKAAKK